MPGEHGGPLNNRGYNTDLPTIHDEHPTYPKPRDARRVGGVSGGNVATEAGGMNPGGVMSAGSPWKGIGSSGPDTDMNMRGGRGNRLEQRYTIGVDGVFGAQTAGAMFPGKGASLLGGKTNFVSTQLGGNPPGFKSYAGQALRSTPGKYPTAVQGYQISSNVKPLGIGSSGSLVRRIQTQLSNPRLYGDKPLYTGGVTGKYDQATANAVKGFQSWYNKQSSTFGVPVKAFKNQDVSKGDIPGR